MGNTPLNSSRDNDGDDGWLHSNATSPIDVYTGPQFRGVNTEETLIMSTERLRAQLNDWSLPFKEKE